MDIKQALIIFAKEPVAGKVKTRLAKTIGNKKALRIYEFLLNKTLEVVSGIDGISIYLFKTPDSASTYFDKIMPGGSHLLDQEGDDLGARMTRAFEQVFADRADKAIIIGTDCPDMNSLILKEAFDSLNKYNTVIGPAQDGGYYLLGMKQPHPNLFQNTQWSTPTVYTETIKRLQKKEETVFIMQELSDIDTEEDLKHLDYHTLV